MKRIIITILLLFLALPGFAGNVLQQEYETAKMQTAYKNPVLLNMTKYDLFENDYLGYLNGAKSIFGELKNLQATLPKNSLDYRYINLAVQQYEMAAKTYNQHLFSMKKIIIDDDDYKNLKNDTKVNIGAYNFIAN